MTDGAAEPVAWLLIEPGWQVVDSADAAAGTVVAITGDSTEDIFNGLAVDADLDKPRYVPSELVGRIVEGRVQLTVTRDQLAGLAEYEEPPESVEISSEPAERPPFARRAWLSIKRAFGG